MRNNASISDLANSAHVRRPALQRGSLLWASPRPLASLASRVAEQESIDNEWMESLRVLVLLDGHSYVIDLPHRPTLTALRAPSDEVEDHDILCEVEPVLKTKAIA